MSSLPGENLQKKNVIVFSNYSPLHFSSYCPLQISTSKTCNKDISKILQLVASDLVS